MTERHRRVQGPVSVLFRDILEVPADLAAVRLLGTLLVRDLDAHRTVARIVEVEAYEADDPASHSYRGRTRRNGAMFARAGTAYVYRAYGIHHCGNVAVGPSDHGAAVLLRAAVVLEGPEPVRRRRPSARTDDALLRGPGCLTAGLGIEVGEHDGRDLLAGGSGLWLGTDGWQPEDHQIHRGPRVGVRLASEVPWRWWLHGDGAVSRYRRAAGA